VTFNCNYAISLPGGPFFCGTGSRVSVFYDPINDFCLKQCLKEKIGKFMERKERNAEHVSEIKIHQPEKKSTFVLLISCSI
jgi:hypothetical protein